MSSGRPVVFACSAGDNPISEAGAGISLVPGDPSALADAIVLMAQLHPEECNKMGKAGGRYVNRQHDSRFLACNFAGVMNGCI